MPVSYIRQKGDAIQMCLVCPKRRPMRRHRQRGLKSMDLFLGQQMKMKKQTAQPTLARCLSLSLGCCCAFLLGKGSSHRLDCKGTQKRLCGSRAQAVPYLEPCFLNVQQCRVSQRIGKGKGTQEIHTSLLNIPHPGLPLPPSLVSLRTSLMCSLPATLSPHSIPSLHPIPPPPRRKSFSLTPSFQSLQVLNSPYSERIAMRTPRSQDS